MAANTNISVIPETVTLPGAVVLDAVAALQALWDYFSFVRGERLEVGGSLDSLVGGWCLDKSSELWTPAFGEETEDDDWVKEPLEVERYARAGELLAELLETHVQELKEDVEETPGWTYAKRATKAKEDAIRIREAGTIDA